MQSNGIADKREQIPRVDVMTSQREHFPARINPCLIKTWLLFVTQGFDAGKLPAFEKLQ
jgi:hypothetical protein